MFLSQEHKCIRDAVGIIIIYLTITRKRIYSQHLTFLTTMYSFFPSPYILPPFFPSLALVFRRKVSGASQGLGVRCAGLIPRYLSRPERRNWMLETQEEACVSCSVFYCAARGGRVVKISVFWLLIVKCLYVSIFLLIL